MPSLRQYATKEVIAQIADIDVANITDKLINRAEAMIDGYVADFYQGGLSKFSKNILEFQSSDTSFDATSLTLSGNGYSTNYFQYQVIELLEGSNKGLIIPVTQSLGGILEFESISGLTGQIACKIYQLGKFPMIKDCQTFKAIPREIVEAVAYQVEFLFNNKKKTNKRTKKSESIGENYSYTNEDGAKDDYANRISPVAKDILQSSGYTAQTI